MTNTKKRSLYESIMKDVAKAVKRRLNESRYGIDKYKHIDSVQDAFYITEDFPYVVIKCKNYREIDQIAKHISKNGNCIVVNGPSADIRDFYDLKSVRKYDTVVIKEFERIEHQNEIMSIVDGIWSDVNVVLLVNNGNEYGSYDFEESEPLTRKFRWYSL